MHFREVQYVHQNWIARLAMLVILPGWLLGLYGFVQQIILGKTFGDNPSSDEGLIISTLLSSVVVLGLIWLVGFSKLETQILDEGIGMYFSPFTSQRIYPWDEIQSADIRTYKPIQEYGDWGWRRGWGRKGQAYNVSGNKGLQLVFKDGRRILIGTQRPDELEQAIMTAKPRR